MRVSLLQSLRHLMVEDGDCLLWRAGTTGTGHPMWRIDKRNQLVRRALWAEQRGTIPQGLVLRVTCGSQRCCNLEHVAAVSRKAIAMQCGALGLMSGTVRSARIAAAKRAGPTAKLTEALVTEIRSSAESGAAMARKLGVSQRLVSQIRRGLRWRQYGCGPLNYMVEVLG